MRRLILSVLLLTCSIVWMGCRGQAGPQGTVAATGKVTYRGQPVPGATVGFTPLGQGRAASGLTDARGRFELTTQRPGDGVMPGKYQVAVAKVDAGSGMSEDESLAYFQKHGKPPTVTAKDLLPSKYKTAATSGLEAEVTQRGKNDFEFDLKD